MNFYNIDPLYTIDGDTIKAIVHLGFNVSVTARLRLQGIDADNLKTGVGNVAAATLAHLLSEAAEIIAESHGTDRWGRFIVTLYTGETANQPRPPAGSWLNVNNYLLQRRLAKPYTVGNE